MSRDTVTEGSKFELWRDDGCFFRAIADGDGGVYVVVVHWHLALTPTELRELADWAENYPAERRRRLEALGWPPV